jgi:hypothetical protein
MSLSILRVSAGRIQGCHTLVNSIRYFFEKKFMTNIPLPSPLPVQSTERESKTLPLAYLPRHLTKAPLMLLFQLQKGITPLPGS